ncbi:TetR/AcrR family transcriptional regulator [Hyphomonas sp.]|nr:TetR/AcrR family transcriptional regulator [Hyphomonas sp.]MDF1805042.1 TetR family transcriptional regulator [Hyphomonas sp.]
MTRMPAYDRDAALEAAIRLFWAKGYHATSLKDLENALNMRPGSIYAAFKSKQALFLAAMERYFEKMQAGFRAHMAEAASPLHGLTSFLRAYAEDGSSVRVHACLLLKTLLEATTTDSEIADPARDYLDRMKGEFEAGLSAAQAAGEFPDAADTARLARRYQAALTSLQVELQRGLSGEELAGFVEDLVEPFDRLAEEAAS